MFNIPAMARAIFHLPNLNALSLSVSQNPHETITTTRRSALEGIPFTLGSPSSVGALCQRIQDLSLSNLHLGPRFSLALAKALEQSDCTVRSLELDLSFQSQVDVVHHIFQALEKNTSLQSLVVWIPNTPQSSSSSSSSYWNNQRRGGCIGKLAQALTHNHHLTTLRLKSRHLHGGSGACSFHTSILGGVENDNNNHANDNNNHDNERQERNDNHHHPTNSTTATGIPRRRNISEQAALAFFKLLEVNRTLTFLGLDDYNILYDDPETNGPLAPLIEFYIDLNTHQVLPNLPNLSRQEWVDLLTTAKTLFSECRLQSSSTSKSKCGDCDHNSTACHDKKNTNETTAIDMHLGAIYFLLRQDPSVCRYVC